MAAPSSCPKTGEDDAPRMAAPSSRPTPGVTTRARASAHRVPRREPSPSLQLGKRTRVAEKSGDDEVNSYAASVQEWRVVDVAFSPDDGTASDVSSPIRQPYMVREPWDEANILAYHAESAKYQAKLDRQNKLFSLDHRGPTTCIDDNEESLPPIQESVTQMIFQTAKAVFGLASYIDGKLLKRCSGFLIGWNKDTRRGTVLTSANLLCTKSTIDDWECPREYAPRAEVQVRFLDDTTQKGKLINYHKHYNIALFEVDMNMSTELLPVSSEQLVDYGQEVFLIGRDEDLNLNASHGRVQSIDQGYFAHYHYMYLGCEISKSGDGGPAIDAQGRIVGMANSTAETAFIPHFFTLKCLRMWRDYKCVPRLHFGLKVKSIKFLTSSRREKMSHKFNIDAGLIVLEVSEGSAAEKAGIRNGDVIESLDGKCIATVVELEMLLLSKCEEVLDNGGYLGLRVDLEVGLFQIRKQKRCTKMLILRISDEIEIIAEGRYPVYAAQKNSADMSTAAGDTPGELIVV